MTAVVIHHSSRLEDSGVMGAVSKSKLGIFFRGEDSIVSIFQLWSFR